MAPSAKWSSPLLGAATWSPGLWWKGSALSPGHPPAFSLVANATEDTPCGSPACSPPLRASVHPDSKSTSGSKGREGSREGAAVVSKPSASPVPGTGKSRVSRGCVLISPWFSVASANKQERRAMEMNALRVCPSLASHGQRWRKTAEYDLTLPPGAEASLPLTGGNLCGTPSLLRKMWMKHKKKSEYLGATNSAFEAD